MSTAYDLDSEASGYYAGPRRNRVRGSRDPDRDAQVIVMRESGAKLGEIGAAFGFTRERARQILLRNGHRKGRALAVDPINILRAARSPDARRMEDVPRLANAAPDDVYRALRALGVRPALLRLYRLRRRRALLVAIQSWAFAHGRTPKAVDFGMGIGGQRAHDLPCGQTVRIVFGSLTAATDLAGLPRNLRGYQAHRAPRGKATHCRRGHEWTAENTYTWSSKRYCRACEKVRARRKGGNVE